jgi:hypothetical protein
VPNDFFNRLLAPREAAFAAIGPKTGRIRCSAGCEVLT